MAQGVGRFQVMATLQAARARVLGLPLPRAKSWGLNRAIFYAAAKRGFKGTRDTAVSSRSAKSRPATREFHLGDDKAYTMTVEGATLFAIGGKVQRPEDFERQIQRRFAGTFRDAWAEALKIVRRHPTAVLESQDAFYAQVYRPRRDVLAKAWNERASERA